MTVSTEVRTRAEHVSTDTEVDVLELLRTLWRRKLFIALMSILTFSLGAIYAFYIAVPVYTASAKLALETRQQQVMDIDSVVTGLSGDQPTINTEVEVIRSRILIKRLVLDLNLHMDPEFNAQIHPEPTISLGKIKSFARSLIFFEDSVEQVPPDENINIDGTIDAVLRALEVSNVRQSYVFELTFTTRDSHKSAAMANRLAELYIEDQIRVKFEKTEQATTWLSERVIELQAALEAAEESLKVFSANIDLNSPKGLEALNRRLKDLRERNEDLRAARLAVQTQQAKLEVAISNGDQQEFMAILQNNALLAAPAEISRLQRPLGAAFETQATAVMEMIANDLERMDRQILLLERSTSEVVNSINVQSDELVKLQQKQREVEASRLIYEAFLTRLKETSVQKGTQNADSRILSFAVAPGGPSAPKRSIIIALFLLLGVVMSSFTVLIKELTTRSFRSGDDLEKYTGYSILGQIPSIPSRKRLDVLRYITEKPNSAAAEAIRNIRTSLILANLDNQPHIILSTSSVPGEGKTTQSISLALNFSGLGEKVLLIEGDIRRRIFKEYFNITGEHGFLSVLSGDVLLEDVISHNELLGCDILIGDNASVNPADVFSSDKFAKLLEDLRDRYDRIIIDTPPVLAVPDARVIGQLVDSIVYAVKWDSTTHRQVLEGLRSLETVNLRASGLVLNQINLKKMKGYGYGDSYTSYEEYHES